MKSHFLIAAVLMAALSSAAAPARAQEVTKDNVDGITNFHRIETTVACTGAIKATAVPEIKKMGFASIINLREASEAGADLDAEAAAAKSADILVTTDGLVYVTDWNAGLNVLQYEG